MAERRPVLGISFSRMLFSIRIDTMRFADALGIFALWIKSDCRKTGASKSDCKVLMENWLCVIRGSSFCRCL